MKKLLVALVVGTLLVLPMSAMAMDSISDTDLNGISGQAGVTVAFGGNQTTTVSLDSVSWGDPDGMGAASGASGQGWVILDGTIGVTVTIADGEELTLDVATADATGYTAGAVTIAGGTTFIAVGLPDQTVTVDVPATMTIGLGTAAATITGTLGISNLENLTIDPGQPSTLYIYAH